ncbi:hypothetical protein B0O95_106123 [Mycetohabitans endofungorum]|uniref:Uncharacterized protein n=1 Tax=Mycetohabitans endofungorum TaxID=417203 RepID=A0A2P5KAI9_9BURK|nr:hypothetical protein B0O95_106123 [Mycetohabitans endofungorum]
MPLLLAPDRQAGSVKPYLVDHHIGSARDARLPASESPVLIYAHKVSAKQHPPNYGFSIANSDILLKVYLRE